MTSAKSPVRGSAMLEFTLVGIPMIFILISTFEIARGMWLYHTLTFAVKEGTRYAIVHGNDCNIAPSNCASRISDIAGRIRDYSTGLIPSEIENMTFESPTRTITCGTLADCLTDNTYFPAAAPGAAQDAGGNRLGGYVQITGRFPFRSAIAMLWPGTDRGINFGTFLLGARSRELIQY